MGMTVGDFIVQRLAAWDVRTIYGYPGDGINGILGALGRASEDMRFIQASHEELAAFMACAHAKFTGTVGVCLATSGPGAIHLLNGLYDAKLDHQPVVAIVGQTSRDAIGGSYQQEVDLHALFKDVAHAYVQTAMSPAQIRHLIDRALRIALTERTVTCVIVPHDLQDEDAVTEPSREHDTVHSGVGYTHPVVVPADADLWRAADVLNAGRKVAILVGAGAANATNEVIQVADLLGAGIAKALLGKAVVPDDLGFVTGAIGLLGTEPSWQMMKECDTLLMIGSTFPYSEFLPAEGQARAVQIDIDGRNLSMRYPMEVNLIGDSARTLRAMLPHLARKQDRAWRTRIEEAVSEWWRELDRRAASEADPVNPQRVFRELSARLPDGAIITCDSGTVAAWYARDLRFREGMRGSLSGGLATMGSAVPYALTAKFAHPDRVVIATTGDGAMQMIGINGLITVAKYWREWADPRLVTLVLNNRDLNMVTWEQRLLAGDPKLPSSQELSDFPYARYAESLGLIGIRIERPDDLGAAWERVLDADRPAVLDVVVDANVPALPPRTSWSQLASFAKSLVKGDPDAVGVLKQTIKQATR
jgi:pyruvate dehydrogenase (quinone)